MAKEIEVKILNVNVDAFRKKLENMGAVFLGENLQKRYVFDIFPYSATFNSILEVLNKNISEKENVLARQKLSSLLHDVADLLSDEDRFEIYRIIKSETLNDLIEMVKTEVPECIFSEEFKKIISKYDTNPNKWVRLRESKGQTTIALKQIYSRKLVNGVRHHEVNNVKEVEIVIDSFETGKQLLEELGYYPKHYQENKRISYLLDGKVHVDIDFWPHIPAYAEIEADTEELVYNTIEVLGYKKEDATSLNTDDVYTSYGLDIYAYKELKFSEAV